MLSAENCEIENTIHSSLGPFFKIPILHLISKIPISIGLRSEDPNFFLWDPKIPNWLLRALLVYTLWVSLPIQGMSDEWVLWLNGAEISPFQPRLAEWGWMDRTRMSFSLIQLHSAFFCTHHTSAVRLNGTEWGDEWGWMTGARIFFRPVQQALAEWVKF